MFLLDPDIYESQLNIDPMAVLTLRLIPFPTYDGKRKKEKGWKRLTTIIVGEPLHLGH